MTHSSNPTQQLIKYSTMAAPSIHPRRSQKPRVPSISPLRKSDTFSARTGLQSDLCSPQQNSPYYPKRSPTSLEEVFSGPNDDVASAREYRLNKFLNDVDNSIHGADQGLTLLNDNDVLAVPELRVNRVIVPDPMAIDEKQLSPDHQHGSDSGLGDSIDTPRQGNNSQLHATSKIGLANDNQEERTVASTRSSVGSSLTTQSAITRSFSAPSGNSQTAGPELSLGALEHIRDRILQPILANPALKVYHPLVESIPKQVHGNFIANLRDLEKTFLYEAPVSLSTFLCASAVAYYYGRDVKRISPSATSFIEFWEISIQCLHSTVDYLTERDQRRPSDRPYTNGYFLDLVEQIRRYAELMRRSREKQENGEELDEMDFTRYVCTPVNSYAPCHHQMTHVSTRSHSDAAYICGRPMSHPQHMALTKTSCLLCGRDEEITISGGLSNNGKPAELVRRKNGKTIPLIPEEFRPIDEAMSSKRPLSDDEYSDDDDVYRSMARRRKSDKAGDVMHVCSTCKKEFKRPCDLTKHEKTHSRPFKCTESSCRYYEVGWPTEKERDRHINDKHSSAPKMYHCKFPPCSYSSKRESNCKQHMEKAHNWTYVRSKSNGRNKAAPSVAGSMGFTPSTPLTPLETPPTAGFTPESNFAQSPWFGVDSLTPFDGSMMDTIGGYDNGMRRDSTTTANTNYTYSSGYSPQQFLGLGGGALDNNSTENINFNSPLFGDTTGGIQFDFSGGYQQPTPALSTGDVDFMMPQYTNTVDQSATAFHVSPTGQADMTLFSPEEAALPDDGFGAGMDLGGPDFLLFPGNVAPQTSNGNNWYPDMGSTQGAGNMDFSGLF